MDEDTELADQEIESIVRSEIARAVEFVDSELALEREQSTRYYRGDPLGNEEEGRSNVVSRDVRDATQEILPDLVEVFVGPEHAVEFSPRNAEDVASAEQATDYVNFVIQQDNPGFLTIHSLLKNACYNKFGIVKWWWDESIEVSYHSFSGLTDAPLGALVEDPEVELVEVSSRPIPELVPQALAAGLPLEGLPQFYSGQVKRTKRSGKARFMALPPEEFIFNGRARSEDDADLIGHRSWPTVSDLVALGYDEDEVRSHLSHSDGPLTNQERDARHDYSTTGHNSANKAMGRVQYTEVFINIDKDGDGIAELCRVCTMGENHKIVDIEPFDEVPMAVFCLDPEPHSIVGHDLADQTKDIQRIKTMVWRGMLDSLALTLDPRTEVVEGMVEMDDLLNPEVGGIVRAKRPGMLRQLITPFVGAEGLQMLDALDQMRDSRTGQKNMALEADALQSTTKAAVNAQVKSAQARKQLMARTLAETGMKRMFAGLLRLIVKHQEPGRMVRLRNEWVPIDPRSWDANMDVTVNVALGGVTEDRINVLTEVLGIQKEALQSLGPNNPWISLGHMSHTVAKLLELNGEADPSAYMNVLPKDFELPVPEPQPDPAQLLAEVEMRKIQSDMAVDAAKLELDRQEYRANVLLKAKDIEAKYGVTVDEALILAAAQEQLPIPPGTDLN